MTEVRLPTFKSSPVRALQAVIATQNWVGNVLWLSLAGLATSVVVGYIALFGYGVEIIERRAGRPENPPVDIDSQRIGDYISKGIWPFLVGLVAHMVLSAVMVFPFGIMGLLMAVGRAGGNDGLALIGLFLGLPVALIFMIGLNLVLAPLLIRAMICQEFAAAFDFRWIWNFIKLMYAEMLVSGLLFGLLSMLIMLAGYMLFCVGYIPAMGIVLGGALNLVSQWYEIYLSLGGEPAPPGPKAIVDAQLVD